MFKCLKCDEVVADGSRICRKCGSIIDEVADPVEESFVMAESVSEEEAIEEDIEIDSTPMTAPSPPAATDKQWRCSNCSAEVPVHFLICWQCQHPRSGQDSPEPAQSEPAPSEPAQSEPAQSEPAQSEPEPLTEPPVEAVLASARMICPKCSSDDLIPNARIHVVAGGRLQVALEQEESSADDPGLISANVCQRCGYVELRASKF